MDSDYNHEFKRCLLFGRIAMTNLDSVLKSRDLTLPTKVHIVKLWFSKSHAWMWELDHKEGWVPKNWLFWTVVLEKNLESPLESKEIKPVNPKWNQSGIFIGRTDAEAEAPILWPPDVKGWLTGKDSEAGKDWRDLFTWFLLLLIRGDVKVAIFKANCSACDWYYQEYKRGTSLVVQLLRIHLPMQVMWTRSQVRELSSRMPWSMARSKKNK